MPWFYKYYGNEQICSLIFLQILDYSQHKFQEVKFQGQKYARYKLEYITAQLHPERVYQITFLLEVSG